MKIYSAIILFATFTSIAYAQLDDYMNFGIKTGMNYSMLDEIPEVIQNISSNPLETFESEAEIGPHFGLFVNYHLLNVQLAIQSDIMYSAEHSKTTKFENGEKRYDIDFKYNYLLWNIIFKFYAFQGLNVGAGPQIGFNLSPNNIYYNDYFYPSTSLQRQQEIRDATYGTTNFQFIFNLGYEFYWGLIIEARYGFGFSDAMRTDQNNIGWIENKNTLSTFQFSIGYAFNTSDF